MAASKKKPSYGHRGKKHSPEAKEKMRQAKLRNPVRYWKGKVLPSHVREAQRRAVSGKPGPNLGKKFDIPKTERWSKKMQEIMRGENNPNWKGGITPLNKVIRASLEYKLWRKSVFERDNYTCIFCGTRGGSLEADHIKPFALFPELRFAIDNGRTLCKPCHRKTPTYGNNIWEN